MTKVITNRNPISYKIFINFLFLIQKAFPEFKFSWLIKEINANLPKELNFIQEANNAEIVRANFTNYKNVVIPEILWVCNLFIFQFINCKTKEKKKFV